MVMLVLVTEAVPATSTQFVPKPRLMELVCDWRIQPRWSAGQESAITPPLTLNRMLVGLLAMVATTDRTPLVKTNANPLPALPWMLEKLLALVAPVPLNNWNCWPAL